MKLAPVFPIAVGLGLAASAAPAQEWVPSRWGAEDTLGAVNEITPQVVLDAVKLVKQGKRYALGQVTGRSTPAFGARTFELFVVGGDGTNQALGSNRMTYYDDWMLTWIGIGTQIDGLGHAGIDHVYYNGKKREDFFSPGGLTRFGIDEIPPIVTRGVVLDLVGYLKAQGSQAVVTQGGVEMLRGGTAINRAELEGAAKRQGVALRKGDVVLLHTGAMPFAEVDPASYMRTLPGLGVGGARWLAAKRPVAVGADTFGLEVLPGEVEGEAFPVHQELITKHGIYILENVVTAELVADEAWEFLFVLGPARFEGAVQMVINPVAIR